jgi:hypothetical protein
MDSIASIIAIVIACLIPVAMTVIIVSDARAGRAPDVMEVVELFGVLLVYGVVAWLVITAVSGLIYAQLT